MVRSSLQFMHGVLPPPAARVLIESSRCTDLRLMTQDKGEIMVRGLQQEGELETPARGGSIRFAPPARPADRKPQ